MIQRSGLLKLGMVFVAGCGVSDPTPPGFVTIDPRWVSGSALADLGQDGRFRFISPLAAADDEISRERAISLSTALMRTAGVSAGNLKDVLEEWHGGPIDFNSILPCGRVLPKVAVFSSIPTVPRQIRTALGSSYIIELCSRFGLPQVEVEIYARTQMVINDAGYIVWPEPYGSESFSAGIPLVQVVDLSPEFGAEMVYKATGVRIAQVPELDGCLFAYEVCLPHLGRHWRFQLEDPVTVRVDDTGELLTTQELYTQAGFGAYDHQRLYVPAPVQPEGQWIDYVTSWSPAGEVRDTVFVRLIRPIALQTVTVHRPNGE